MFDSDRSNAFSDRLMAMLNEGALCLMISIGHRSGLFDVMAANPPMDSVGLAAKAGLSERYVREWLSALVTARIVEYEVETGRFALPAEHAAWVTRAATPNNLAVFAQYIPLLGSVEEDVLHCFRNGGGVAYDRYGRFHDVMAEDSGQTVLSCLFSHILPLAPGLTQRLEDGIRVLDVGCGSGLAINQMAERFPRSLYYGFDLCEDAVERGREEARRRGLENVRFEARDLSDFDRTAPFEEFDFVTTFDAVHDQAKPLSVLKGINRTLRADGVYLMQDIHGSCHVHQNLENPMAPLLYTISCLHCMTVSLAQGGEGLGAMWGVETAQRFLAEAGFGSVEMHRLEHDFQNAYFVARKG